MKRLDESPLTFRHRGYVFQMENHGNWWHMWDKNNQPIDGTFDKKSDCVAYINELAKV